MPDLRTQASPPPHGGTPHSAKAEAMAQNLERLAWLMDRAIPIPGTKLRVGLDAILGLIPGVGDSLTGVIQTALVLTTLANYRVPKAVAARMATNVVVDNLVGLIPGLGDLFDMGFKANTRNMALLREVRERQHRGEAMPSAPSIRYLITVGLVLVAILASIFIGAIVIAAYIVNKLILDH